MVDLQVINQNNKKIVGLQVIINQNNKKIDNIQVTNQNNEKVVDLQEINKNNVIHKTFSNGITSPFYSLKNIQFPDNCKKSIVSKYIDKSLLDIRKKIINRKRKR